MANTEDVKPQNMLCIALDRIWRMKPPEKVEMSCCPCCLVHCAAQIGIHTPNGMRSHRVRLWSWKLWREYLKLVKICDFWWGTLSTWTCAVSLCAGWSGRLKGHWRVAFQDAALQWKSQWNEWHHQFVTLPLPRRRRQVWTWSWWIVKRQFSMPEPHARYIQVMGILWSC